MSTGTKTICTNHSLLGLKLHTGWQSSVILIQKTIWNPQATLTGPQRRTFSFQCIQTWSLLCWYKMPFNRVTCKMYACSSAGNVVHKVFTARSSYASAVIGIVILTVRLSHASFVTKRKNLLPIFLIPHDNNRGWWVMSPSTWNLHLGKVTHPFEKRRLRQISEP